MSATPEVGWWATFCCEEDLHQIETAEDLAEHLEEDAEQLDEFDRPFWRYWPTKDAALADISREG
jgi:hypothetical protein